MLFKVGSLHAIHIDSPRPSVDRTDCNRSSDWAGRAFQLGIYLASVLGVHPLTAGFVGLTLPLCCGDSPLHLFSSDNSCCPAAFPNFLFSLCFRGLELLVPHCAGRTNSTSIWWPLIGKLRRKRIKKRLA